LGTVTQSGTPGTKMSANCEACVKWREQVAYLTQEIANERARFSSHEEEAMLCIKHQGRELMDQLDVIKAQKLKANDEGRRLEDLLDKLHNAEMRESLLDERNTMLSKCMVEFEREKDEFHVVVANALALGGYGVPIPYIHNRRTGARKDGYGGKRRAVEIGTGEGFT